MMPADSQVGEDGIHAILRERGILLGAGGLPPRDGMPHRYATEEHPDRKDAAILLWSDGGGWVQVHGVDPKPVFFRREKAHRLSRSARARIGEEQRRRQTEKAQRQAEVALKARQLLLSYPLATDEHPYLRRKGVASHRLRVVDGGWSIPRCCEGLHPPLLVVPLIDPDGEVVSLEFIDVDGQKRFLAGGRKHGCSFPIGCPSGKPGETICIGEGYATMATVSKASGWPCIVAFDCGNLLPVSQAVRALYPKAQIVICADDDHQAGRSDNPGLTHAYQAARAVSGLVARPRFAGRKAGRHVR